MASRVGEIERNAGVSGSARGAPVFAVGVDARPALAVAEAVRELVEGFDPAVTGSRDAMDLVAVFSTIEHLASAGVALAAGRVAETNLWKRGGHRSAAHWLARQTGMGVGDAVRLLQTAQVVETAPDTLEALKTGQVSTRQAKAIGAAEAAAPEKGAELLARIGSSSAKELDDESARIVHAASRESDATKAEWIRKSRRLRNGMNADGSGWGTWLLPGVEHARLMAAMEPIIGDIFTAARTAGVREPAEAYAADALMRLVDRHQAAASRAPEGRPAPGAEESGSEHRCGSEPITGPDPSDGRLAQPCIGVATAANRGIAGGEPADADPSDGRPGDPDGSNGLASADDSWSFAKVICRIDAAALDRGELEPGEICEIAGQGPIPIADAWRIIDGGALIAAVTTRGTAIDKVVHLGRRPTALQRTSLEWATGGTCAIEGCDSVARFEIDHVEDWATTKVTQLRHLAGVCGRHHDLKSHHGCHFGPPGSNGKRRLIPPQAEQPPPGAGGHPPRPDSDGPRPGQPMPIHPRDCVGNGARPDTGKRPIDRKRADDARQPGDGTRPDDGERRADRMHADDRTRPGGRPPSGGAHQASQGDLFDTAEHAQPDPGRGRGDVQ